MIIYNLNNRTNNLKKIILLFAVLLICCISLALGANAESYNCIEGKHKDVISSSSEATVTYTCELCGRRYTDNLPPDRHVWGEWVIEKAATCTEAGRKYRTCLLHSPHSAHETIPAKGHNYSTTLKEPTCMQRGIKTFICRDCANTYTEPYAEPSGHSYVMEIAKEAACGTSGEKRFSCTCGDTYTEEIAAVEHKYGEWIIDVPAAEGVDGTQHKDCEHGCGSTLSEIIPALSLLPQGEPAQEEPHETSPDVSQKAAVFNGTDMLIHTLNLAFISFFVLLLAPMISAILWEQKKQNKFLKMQDEKRKEADKYDYR